MSDETVPTPIYQIIGEVLAFTAQLDEAYTSKSESSEQV